MLLFVVSLALMSCHKKPTAIRSLLCWVLLLFDQEKICLGLFSFFELSLFFTQSTSAFDLFDYLNKTINQINCSTTIYVIFPHVVLLYTIYLILSQSVSISQQWWQWEKTNVSTSCVIREKKRAQEHNEGNLLTFECISVCICVCACLGWQRAALTLPKAGFSQIFSFLF